MTATADRVEVQGMKVTGETLSGDETVSSTLNDPVRREPTAERSQTRRVGLTTDLGTEWQEAVREARVPDAFAPLDADLE